ncbi:amino acid permease [Photobacterium sp. R1]
MSLSAVSHPATRNRVNSRWVATHFATAMGIGVLFVPQALGPGTIGISAFLVMVVLCIPLSYLNHKTLSGLIISGGTGGGSVATIKSMAGQKASLLYAALLFISSFSICMINFIALVAAISQSVPPEYTDIARIAAAIGIGLVIYLFSAQGHGRIVSLTKYIAVPLSLVLLFLSCLLIPKWDWQLVSAPSELHLKEIITFIPIIIFAMNFSPCVSGYIESSMRDSNNNKTVCEQSASRTLLASCFAIAVTVMFFSFSVSMSLNSALLDSADKNANSISLVAQLMGGGWFNVVGFFIVAAASFGALMGTVIGVKDGLKDSPLSKKVDEKGLMVLVTVALVGIGILNPNIIDLIKMISGPAVIAVGMLFPAIVMIKNRHYQLIYFVAIGISLLTFAVGLLM